MSFYAIRVFINVFVRTKRLLEVEPSMEPPAKVARVGDYTYDTTQTGDYTAYYQNYFGYDYGPYSGYSSAYGTAPYDPSSGTTF